MKNGTDPTKKDTDGARFDDKWEVTNGTDPLDPDDPEKQVPSNPNPALLITDGVFENPGNTKPEAYIGFTTAGYAGNANVYYAVVAHNAPTPGLPAYTGYLGALTADTYTGQKIRLTDAGGAVQPNADVYVVLAQGGAVSAPVKIWTQSGNGGAWNWDNDGNGIPVTGITMTNAASTTEKVSLTLTGTVEPSNATWRNIVWTVKTQGTTGASISRDSNGAYILNTTAAGTVTVTAAVPHSEPAYTKDFDITVQSAISVTLDTYAQTIPIPGTGTFTLTVTVSPFTSGQAVTWANSNSSAAEVSSATGALDGSGKASVTVTGKSMGTASITATAGGVTSAACVVTVTEKWDGDIYGPAHKTWYVSSSGNDSNAGTSSGSALASMAKALEKIKTYYKENKSSWPQTSPAAIYVSGTVGSQSATSAGAVYIDNWDQNNKKTMDEYPPILLTGGGTNSSTLTGVQTLVMAEGAVLIMENLKISMTGSPYNPNYTGVYVTYGSRFIMRSGEISGFDSGKNRGGAGGGLNVLNKSWAFMNGGTIKKNKRFSGGGVFIENSTFVMNDGGTITENDAFEEGGVCIGALVTFFMRCGEISKNTCTLDGANYTAYYGKNSVGSESYGGGVGLSIREHASAFVKTGGTIYGSNDSNNANKVHVSNRGDAVAIRNQTNTSMYKHRETTLGPGVMLYYNHNGTTFQLGYESGW